MADFVNTTTCAVELSVNDKPAGWVTLTRAEADLALAIPQQYRKWTGSAVAEMTAPEKSVVDAARAQAAKDASVASVGNGAKVDLLRAVALVMLDEVNALRTRAGLATRTVTQLQDALKAKMG